MSSSMENKYVKLEDQFGGGGGGLSNRSVECVSISEVLEILARYLGVHLGRHTTSISTVNPSTPVPFESLCWDSEPSGLWESGPLCSLIFDYPGVSMPGAWVLPGS